MKKQRDKKFVIDSIKMDLFRVVTATGDLTKEAPIESVKTFMEHADKDFDKIKLNSREKKIRKEIKALATNLEALSNPRSRLEWAEDVLTARCRL